MSIFKYTLPSGAQFEVRGPANATQEQADNIFYSQVAAGALVGYSAGQTLQSTETLIESFEISRLERGTAGVDITTILAINAGLPVIATVPNLSAVQISNAVTEADIAVMRNGLGPTEVGVLSSIEVQSLMAQLRAQVDQASNVVTIEKGIGMFGFNSCQLEMMGYIKPGTTNRYLKTADNLTNPPNFITVMNSPTIWTGLNGVTNVNDVLNSVPTQIRIQQQLMEQGYAGLLAAGLITETAQQSPTAMVGQVYTQSSATSGVFQPVSDVNLLTAAPATLTALSATTVETFVANIATNPAAIQNISPANLQSMLNGIMENPSLLRNIPTDQLQAFSKAVTSQVKSLADISTVDLKSIATGVTNNLSLDKLSSQLNSLTSMGKEQFNQIVGGANNAIDMAKNLSGQAQNAIDQASKIATQVQGQVGSLVNNASKYGTQATELWNKGVSGNLKDAMDSVGKMGDYATKFAKDKLSGLVSQVKSAAGFTNTVNRSTVDAAVNKIIGTPSITPPKFTMPNSLSDLTDMRYAQNMLSQAKDVVGQVQGQVGAIQQNVTNLAGQVQGQISQVTGTVTNMANQATGFVTDAKSQLASARGIVGRFTKLG